MLRGVRVAVAVGWFPEGEWAKARERWPELAAENPVDHGAYVREVELRLRRLSPPPGVHLRAVALDVDGIEAFCEASPTPTPAGTGQARGAYASHLAREGHGVAWPPERNRPCWCESGAKYKRCCGAVRGEPAAAGASDAGFGPGPVERD
jgi:hypothetical protein